MMVNHIDCYGENVLRRIVAQLEQKNFKKSDLSCAIIKTQTAKGKSVTLYRLFIKSDDPVSLRQYLLDWICIPPRFISYLTYAETDLSQSRRVSGGIFPLYPIWDYL